MNLDGYERDINTVKSFVERAYSGKPEDRWTTGAKGNAELAAACQGLLRLIQVQSGAMEMMLADLKQRGQDSMEPHVDPARAAKDG